MEGIRVWIIQKPDAEGKVLCYTIHDGGEREYMDYDEWLEIYGEEEEKADA